MTSETGRVVVGADDCGRLPEEHGVEHGQFVRQVLDRVGDKWSLLVVANLRHGPRRYGDLEQVLTGISQRMLTLTLRRLGDDGLIRRTAYAEIPPRVEYTLTPLGDSLLDAALPLIRWASDHHADLGTKP